MSRLWRVHHPGLAPRAGTRLELERNESHHVRRVLRLGPGDPVAVFDGRGSEWLARITDDPGPACVVELEREMREPVEAPLPITLYQAACRAEKLEWVVQKACEIGVADIHVVRADGGGRGSGVERRLARLQRIAVESCKQCGRRAVPTLGFVAGLPAVAGEGRVALLLDPESDCALAQVVEGPRPASVALAVGPEGGFSRSDVERWVGAGWLPTGMGPRILRTETAGLVAASIVLYRWGDVGRSTGTGGSPAPPI